MCMICSRKKASTVVLKEERIFCRVQQPLSTREGQLLIQNSLVLCGQCGAVCTLLAG